MFRGTAPYLSIRKEEKVLVYSLARLSDLQKYHFKTKISEGEGRISYRVFYKKDYVKCHVNTLLVLNTHGALKFDYLCCYF